MLDKHSPVGREGESILNFSFPCLDKRGHYNLPDPDILAKEIIENLEAALEQFRSIGEVLGDS